MAELKKFSELNVKVESTRLQGQKQPIKYILEK